MATGIYFKLKMEQTLLQKIFTLLNHKRVKYMVVGGIAVNLYGIERTTADLDLVVELERKNLEKLVDAFRSIGFRPKMPVKFEDLLIKEKRRQWIEEKNMVVFTLHSTEQPFLPVDILIKETMDFKKVFKDRVKLRAGNTTIPLIPLEELIAMKEGSPRPQDRADVYYLKRILER